MCEKSSAGPAELLFCPVMTVCFTCLFCLSCFTCLFCLSRFTCLFCLSCFTHAVLPVLFCLHVLPVLFPVPFCMHVLSYGIPAGRQVMVPASPRLYPFYSPFYSGKVIRAESDGQQLAEGIDVVVLPVSCQNDPECFGITEFPHDLAADAAW